MTDAVPTLPLTRILRLDALTCIAMGMALIVAGGLIAGITGLPVALLWYAGIALLPIGLFMAATAQWWPASAPAVWLIILGNIGWVVASLAVPAMISTVTALGLVFILGQAGVVAVLAYLEWVNLERQALPA